MNILTFDIEEWFLEKLNHGNRVERIAQYDQLLREILDLLDERNFKATFFCVGGMATDFPHVVKTIADRGHEIGCHSNTHTWLNKMSQKDVFDDTRQSIDSLEQCIGKKILCYRAPAFSIGQENIWAFEILAQCGIKCDASVFPAERDFGGFPNFGHKIPVRIIRNGVSLKEFPICTTNILGKELAFSGGGYFRFFPLWFVRRELSRADYSMCYFHLDDIITETNQVMTRKEYEDYFKQNGSIYNRYKRYIKSNLGKKNAYHKMRALIKTTQFVNLSQADEIMDWNSCPIIELKNV